MTTRQIVNRPISNSTVEHLSLGCGGSRGILILGALSVLQKEEWLAQVKTFYGCSVGSIIATGLCLGVSCDTMKRRVIRNPIRFSTQPDDVLKNTRKFGMHGGKALRTFIKKVTRVGTKTFRDVYEQTGKTLVVVVCNITTRQIEHWSHESHPTTKVITALRLSCGVPFVFTHGTHQGHVYVDGAVGEPVPWTRAPERTLAVSFDDPTKPPQTVMEFVHAMSSIKREQPVRWNVRLQPGALSQFEFAPDEATVNEAYASGIRQARDFCKKNV
jgi:predicted acylesterase/phospholipase RssA